MVVWFLRGTSGGGANPRITLIQTPVCILMPSSFTPVEFWQLEDQNPPAKKCHESSVFTLKEMEEATNSFSEENFIGKGGFGKVYKGTLRSGEVWFGKHTFKIR